MHRSLVLCLLLAPSAARASKIEVPRAELCAISSLVVIGEVTGQDSTWSEGSKGMVLTVSDLAVERTLRGDPVRDLRVTTRGGSFLGLTQHVSTAAVLRPDRRYLLLLAPRPDATWRVVGGEDGVVLLPWDGDLALVLDSLGGCLAR